MALDFSPFEFFKEEIRNENATIKIRAVERLDLIASAMGQAKTTTELVPYLVSVMHEEPYCNDEEFLFQLAKQFAMLKDHVTGNWEALMSPLEHLASQEETVIRDEAVASLSIIVEKNSRLVPEILVPMLKRLSTKTDFFTARVSACSLFPTAYKYATEEQKTELRKQYAVICQDDTPMVRRAAAHKMKALCTVCKREHILEDLISVYKNLSQEDTQDTIRVATVHTTLVLAGLFNKEENLQHTVTVIKEAAEDRSWRVRLTIAKNFDGLCKAFGQEIVVTHLIGVIVQLMKDQEHEVRKEAILSILPCLGEGQGDRKISPSEIMLTPDIFKEHIIPQFNISVTDSMQQVRAALASVIGAVAKLIGRDSTQRLLLPMISDLMKDEYHDVRLSIVSQSGIICGVLGVDGLVHSLLHSIQSLIMDNHWRIRQSVVKQVPELARLFGVDMYQSKLEALFLSSLRDSVHDVRSTAIEHLKDIAKLFGKQWTVERLMPRILEQYSQSAGYANRVTTLQVLPQLAVVMDSHQVVAQIYVLIDKASRDAVPNVRFCALKQLVIILDETKDFPQDTIDSKIRPMITELSQDSDVDVQFYASQVQQRIDNPNR